MELNKGAWTPEEDRKLSECIQIHGEKRWRLVPAKAGLSRCGKSCRLRWLNYLRPNIKRGNISDQEEDLIIRLHKLLGNRWSLIAGRLPGRTDNEIKNYWNSHLSKRVGGARNEKKGPKSHNSTALKKDLREVLNGPSWKDGDVSTNEFNVDEWFQFQEDVRVGTPLDSPEKKEGMERFGGSAGSSKGHLGWDWVRELLDFDEGVG
ncbi:hypothetical protein MRB53_008694 [Persea americana]|uniref:Uncharacterized protein n=1 Tax=Persea americana TaxID=3435 RepID=A0ACC2MMH2_PERAE|nr:hypothetical protein MRB53_008694 [Persea americana]